MKLITVIGTRPEIIKLAPTLQELDKYTQHVIVHTGQNYDYELNEVFFNELSLRKPDYFLDAVGKTLAETIGNIIAKSDEVFEKEQPDAVLVYGDTNSCLSVISAKRRKIPIFHMEAGNRCFDQRVPEEINRKIVDHLSDINLTITEHARKYLIAEGLRPERTIKIGSSMLELINQHLTDISNSTVLDKLDLQPNNYFVVSAHREENIDSELNFNNLIDSLNAIAVKYDKPIIFSTHPRTMKKIEQLTPGRLNERIQILKPFGFFDYIALQKNAFCVISDSGTITEESSILSFPAITIRNAHERPEGMDEGTLIMSGLVPNKVIDAITVTVDQYRTERPFKIVSDYNVDNVSKKVVKIVLSYTDYINREIWRKN